jgi:hypothetical protein
MSRFSIHQLNASLSIGRTQHPVTANTVTATVGIETKYGDAEALLGVADLRVLAAAATAVADEIEFDQIVFPA